MTPKEYGILQAFPMDDWKQVVSDSQAYKQFGNAVTTTVFTAIAEEIAKSIYAAEESEEQNMEAENKNFTGMNEPEEKPTAESILAAAEAEAKVAAEREETTKTAIPAEETITPNSLANGMLQFLLDSGIVASACVTDETEKMFAKHIKEELDGITIGETPEILRDWEAAQNAVNDMLSKYAPGGYMGKNHLSITYPIKRAVGSRRKNTGFIQRHCRSHKVGAAYDIGGHCGRYVRPGPCADYKRQSGIICRIFG